MQLSTIDVLDLFRKLEQKLTNKVSPLPILSYEHILHFRQDVMGLNSLKVQVSQPSDTSKEYLVFRLHDVCRDVLLTSPSLVLQIQKLCVPLLDESNPRLDQSMLLLVN